MRCSDTTTESKPLTISALCVLALLSAVAPIATDMYLPGFPNMSEDLGAGASGIQLTLTSFLIGLALGQLIIGPLSDHYGRRRPLLLGTALAIGSGVLCALVDSVGALIVLRALQGLGGAAGIVLARAIIADRSPDAATTARQTQIMMMIGGVAPILAPITGSLIVSLAGWRAVFVVIALLSLLAFIGVLRNVGESLPQARRSHAGGGRLIRTILQLFRHRLYVGYTLVTGFSFMALFGYIAASPFVFQKVLGLSPTQYSIAFGVNALGLIVFGAVSAKIVSRVAPTRIILCCLILLLVASGAALACILLNASAFLILPCIFLAVASVGPLMGNASALAIHQVPESAGTASAVLGAIQFALGALASPLVGVLGESNALPMALLMVVAALLALYCYVFLARRPLAIPSPQPETSHA